MNLLRIAARVSIKTAQQCEEEAKHQPESVAVNITYKSAPEYKSIEDFAQFLIDDERTEFTHEDLAALNYRLRKQVAEIKKELEAYGFKLAEREKESKARGFKTSDHDRWYGPGSDKTHGGSGFSNFE